MKDSQIKESIVPLTRYSAGLIVFAGRQDVIRILLLRYAAGHWGFPKGHLEPGETARQAALRELFEETGLRGCIVTDFSYQYSYPVSYSGLPKQCKQVTLFLARLCGKTEKVVLSDEHTDYAWLSMDQAHQRLTYDNAKEALRQAKDWIESVSRESY